MLGCYHTELSRLVADFSMLAILLESNNNEPKAGTITTTLTYPDLGANVAVAGGGPPHRPRSEEAG